MTAYIVIDAAGNPKYSVTHWNLGFIARDARSAKNLFDAKHPNHTTDQSYVARAFRLERAS